MLAATAYGLTPGSWNKGIFKTLMEEWLCSSHWRRKPRGSVA